LVGGKARAGGGQALCDARLSRSLAMLLLLLQHGNDGLTGWQKGCH